MVRVIPVHNFLSQNAGEIDEPTATCTVNILGQDMLLLALTTHCVKVHSLTDPQSKLLTIFPTVDMVKQLLHCDKGNYVATLEKKMTRNEMSNNFVRIYVNWEILGNQNQAMRARIAGRVTPSLNRTLNSLEMIELPLSGQPTQIACCQTTGNLLVAMGNEAVIHELKVETHQLSKRKFLDFEIRPWSLKFSFQPSFIEIAEEFISVMSKSNFMLFKLTNHLYDDMNWNDAIERLDCTNNYQNTKQMNQNNIKSSEELINDMTTKSTKSIVDFTKSISNKASYVDWDQLVFEKSAEFQKSESLQPSQTETKDFLITLPLIKSNQSQILHSLKPLIVAAPELSVSITTKFNEDSWSENFSIEHLLRLKIAPVTCASTDKNKFDYFTCGILKPRYYRSKFSNIRIKKSLLRSMKYYVFNGVTCLICTNQEGYLYHFSPESSKEISADLKCCTIYPFTCPVSHVALENTALHALTEAGLESYTLKISDNLSKISDEILIEKLSNKLNDEPEPISLIGLRPFLGVRKLLHASKCLVLLASDNETWTYNSLSLPNPEDVYNDILNAANNHKESSRKTYEYLLREAYTVLKMAKNISYYSSDTTYSSNNSTTTSLQHIDNLFKQSCAYLADYYISSEYQKYWNLSIYYYKIAGLDASSVLKRENINQSPGLITYISDILVNLKPGPEADALFQEHNIIDILIKRDSQDIIKLILVSSVLREYATEKLINILSTFERNDSCLFSLVLLYVQADKHNQADKMLEKISNSFIVDSTLTNWSWLFDVTNSKKGNVITTFSEYAGILMKQKMNILVEILRKLVNRNAIKLNQIIQIFLAYLPSRVGRDGRIAGMVLQLFLETYLQHYYENTDDEICVKPLNHDDDQINDENLAICESFKLLVRSYLVELVQGSLKSEEIYDNNNKKILFENLRPSFFDCVELYENNRSHENKGEKIIIKLAIIKLQALLASGCLPNECYQEVEQFLETQNIDGSLTLKILCAKNIEKGMQLLTDNCPRVLLHYVKEKYTKEIEWKQFVQFLIHQMDESRADLDIHLIYDELLKDTAIYIAQTMSIRVLQRILPKDSGPASQKYIDLSTQVVHADYIKTMIIGTGQHLLSTINF